MWKTQPSPRAIPLTPHAGDGVAFGEIDFRCAGHAYWLWTIHQPQAAIQRVYADVHARAAAGQVVIDEPQRAGHPRAAHRADAGVIDIAKIAGLRPALDCAGGVGEA